MTLPEGSDNSGTGRLMEIIVADRAILRNDKLVALCLARFAHRDGTGAYPSVDTLAAYSGLSPRTVTDCLRNLVALGYLRVVAKAAQRRPTEYALTFQVSSFCTPHARQGCRICTPATAQGRKSRAQGRKSDPPGVQNLHPNPIENPIEPTANDHVDSNRIRATRDALRSGTLGA